MSIWNIQSTSINKENEYFIATRTPQKIPRQ